jgi:hypothetical protein
MAHFVDMRFAHHFARWNVRYVGLVHGCSPHAHYFIQLVDLP